MVERGLTDKIEEFVEIKRLEEVEARHREILKLVLGEPGVMPSTTSCQKCGWEDGVLRAREEGRDDGRRYWGKQLVCGDVVVLEGYSEESGEVGALTTWSRGEHIDDPIERWVCDVNTMIGTSSSNLFSLMRFFQTVSSDQEIAEEEAAKAEDQSE